MIHSRTMQPYAPADWYPGEPTRWGQPTADPITRLLPRIGQLNPIDAERLKMMHGRNLAGVDEAQRPAPGQRLVDLEKEDDVYGSGIFDPPGRLPTVNRDMGVFGDHPSMPGYIGREVQFAISKEVSDIASGADVVIVPSGGMTFQERGGKQVYFDRFGPTPMPPPFQPARVPSSRMRAYVSMLPGPASAKPRPQPPSPYRPVPAATRYRPLPLRSEANVAQIAVPATRAYVPREIPSNVRISPVPMAGLGADERPGWGSYAVAGVLVGAGAAVLWGVIKGKRR